MELERFVYDLNAYREEFNAWLQSELEDSKVDFSDISAAAVARSAALNVVAKKWIELSDKHIAEWKEKYPLESETSQNKNEAT